jgi:O-methyltransferase involved in polyketide biosynthesis
MISTKKGILSELKKDCTQNEGTLIMEPLNALDEKRFREIVAQFPAGELVIVNEGLLMYFNQAEREFVCRLIHDILKERGGYWITADAYLKGSHDNLGFRMDPEREAFYQEHDLHENRFDSFEEAENFFKKMGFKIEMEANVDYGKMQSLNKFMQYSTPEDRERMKDAGRLQATWCLKPI